MRWTTDIILHIHILSLWYLVSSPISCLNYLKLNHFHFYLGLIQSRDPSTTEIAEIGEMTEMTELIQSRDPSPTEIAEFGEMTEMTELKQSRDPTPPKSAK